jgi:thioredoxin 1
MKGFLTLITAACLLAVAPAIAGEVSYSRATLERLLASGQPVAVDFHADWCPVCRAQAPIIKELLTEPQLQRLTVVVADYDTELALRKSLNVAQQSTIVVFRHGKEVARSTGDTTRAGLAALLSKAVA